MKDLKDEYRRKLQQALHHLEYSFNKVQALSADPGALDEETLETWESFCARFSRVVDIFLSKYVRTAVLENDPGFRGSLRDFVDQGEKLGLVDDADAWMELRAYRNLFAHEYEEAGLARVFERARHEAPRILRLRKQLG